MELKDQLREVKTASKELALLTEEKRNQMLKNIACLLIERKEEILTANQKDIANAEELSKAMIERLTLTCEKIEAMAKQVEIVVKQKDPLHRELESIQRPNGLLIKKMSIPLGVMAIIYESRPNVTIDVACLCIKSGNACVLKGGKEAHHTNQVLVALIHDAMRGIIDEHAVMLIDSSSLVLELIQSNGLVDVAVPRGGKGLIDFVVKNATVPVIETGAGICHQYVDKKADLDQAVKVAVNAKASRPSVCNAIETLLVHKEVAEPFLTALKQAMEEVHVVLKGDERIARFIDVEPICTEDYATEYNDYILNLKIVDSLEEAVAHIQHYSTGHSETIMTQDESRAQYFIDHIDSACVYINASTRFSDGGEFGFGLELGISTQKLHARGPLGLQQMTTYRYVIFGDGQIR
ncbi:MAG: glutamate-5-semialdehyde dehydrogenase [Beduini sp.]|uniref:glutamate-5-semialdehyde dehydrogenase n=1 Tax=Beduini sp. TaxID=1922300 RepID=UPI0039A05B98